MTGSSSVARLLYRRCLYCESRANTLSVFNRQTLVLPATAHSNTMASFSASLASLPEPAITEGARESAEVARQRWRVVVAIYVQRMPSLSREITPLVIQHKEMLDQVTREKSKLSDFELEVLEHNRSKKDRIKKTLQDEQSKTLAGDEADEFDDLQEARELELLEFKPAPRETEADQLGDMRSLNRKLDTVLHLLVKKPRNEHAWQMPQGGVEPGESLLEAAKRELVEECGSALDVKFYSPAPHAVFSYRHPPQSGQASHQVGSKVFFMKAFYHGKGDVELASKELEDYMWVTREEMQSYVSELYYQAIRPILAE